MPSNTLKTLQLTTLILTALLLTACGDSTPPTVTILLPLNFTGDFSITESTRGSIPGNKDNNFTYKAPPDGQILTTNFTPLTQPHTLRVYAGTRTPLLDPTLNIFSPPNALLIELPVTDPKQRRYLILEPYPSR